MEEHGKPVLQERDANSLVRASEEKVFSAPSFLVRDHSSNKALEGDLAIQ